jgi:hypothetical protein
LVFDESCDFIFGVEAVGNKVFFKLEDERIEINPKIKDLKKLFTKVKANWVINMIYLNEFTKGDFREKFNGMVNSDILDKRYFLPVKN